MTYPTPTPSSTTPHTGARSPLRHLFTTYPSRYATMQQPGSDAKYINVSHQLTDTVLRNHLLGKITVACALEDQHGMAQAAAADIDHGGALAVQQIQAEALRCGYQAFSFISKGAKDHDGGYVWIVFDQAYQAERLRSCMETICTAVGIKAEYRTNRADTRLPFGWHRHSRTYGRMIDPDGVIYDLDTTDERRAALQLFARTTNHQAPPVLERPASPITSHMQPLTVCDTATDLLTLRLRGCELNARITAGRLDPITRAALRYELYEVVNPAITKAVPAVFNDRFTCGEILERHGARLIGTRGNKQFYGALAGDAHSHTKGIKYSVDTATNHCHSFTESGRIPKVNGDRDAFALYTDLDHGGNARHAQQAAAHLLAPVVRSLPSQPQPAPAAQIADVPAAPTHTPEQRETWRVAKARQRAVQSERDRMHAATVHADLATRANRDPLLQGANGNGNIAFLVLLELFDQADGSLSCAPSVGDLAIKLKCCKGHIRRGLALLEGHYITTPWETNPKTGTRFRGGRNGQTPTRTFIDYTAESSTTLQTLETGRSSQNNDDRHVLVTRSHEREILVTDKRGGDHFPGAAVGDVGQFDRPARLDDAPVVLDVACEPGDLAKHPGIELETAPAVIEPVAIEGGASFTPAAALPFVERPYSERTKADMTSDERWAALKQLHTDWRISAPEPAMVDQGDQPSLIAFDPQPTVYSPPRDPLLRQRYYRLLGRARKASSLKQRRYLEYQASRLEEPPLFDTPAQVAGDELPGRSTGDVTPPPLSVTETEPMPVLSAGADAVPLGYGFMAGLDEILQHVPPPGESSLQRWLRERELLQEVLCG
jgi:hypothetical protein